MKPRKYKVTVVERGRLVHLKVRGFGDPYSRCRIEDKGLTWILGHAKETSVKGAALLAAEALRDDVGPIGHPGVTGPQGPIGPIGQLHRYTGASIALRAITP